MSILLLHRRSQDARTLIESVHFALLVLDPAVIHASRITNKPQYAISTCAQKLSLFWGLVPLRALQLSWKWIYDCDCIPAKILTTYYFFSFFIVMPNSVKCQRANIHVGMARGPARRRHYYFLNTLECTDPEGYKQSKKQNEKLKWSLLVARETAICNSHYDNYFLFYPRYQ